MDGTDLRHLRRAVDLAAEAVAAGDEPFGSVLVDGQGILRREDRNRVGSGDGTLHPELVLAQWAAANLPLEERAGASVYTSGEHCPMCSAAHAWAGLGRIVYATSAAQLTAWSDELGLPASPVRALPVHDVAPGLIVEGPAPEFADEVRELHRRHHNR